MPLFITEGIPKADAAVSINLCCIALLGVFNFRGSNEVGGKTALADWESVAPNGRTVYIAFVTAGLFAGLSGALLAPLEQTVSPSTAHWTKSAEPVMATLIGGPLSFLGPILGAVVYLGLKELIVRFTEYWLLVFGLVLLATVLTFRGGLLGAASRLRMRRRQA